MPGRVGLFAMVSLLAGVLALQACRHPLSIVGEGDIVDINQSGHGCSLEQFRGGDKACTDNEVSGDYDVNYHAQPRPGWRFVRWDGPCSPGSDFQHCRLVVGKAVVDGWDEAFPDADTLPSVAIFQPITGNTGYLAAGTAVAGVSYETPTKQGVTDLDGGFQYGENETVRFIIGDTVLGETRGKAKVTPFDLAGSPILTGVDIIWALQGESREIDPFENVFREDPEVIDSLLSNQGEYYEKINPFHGVINMAVLLHSLDADGDPGNGIVIRAGVAKLLRGFSLDVGEHWEQFQAESTLRRAVAEASRQHRFSKAHGVSRPEVALENLYGTLQINPRIVAVSSLQQSGIGPWPSYTEYFYYNADGTMRQHDDGTPDAVETWQYDTYGNVIRHEADGERFGIREIETWQYDSHGNVIRKDWDGESGGPDGNPDIIDTWQYNADSNAVRHEHRFIDGYNSDSIESWQYDSRGRVTSQQWDQGEEGMVGATQTWQYDANGNVTRASFSLGDDIWYIHKALYDSDGKVTRVTAEGRGERTGFTQSRRDWTYDNSGKLTRLTEQSQTEYNGERGSVQNWRYDAAGRVISHERLEDEGPPETESWQYDGAGRMSRYECQGGCAGRLTDYWLDHRIDTWQYHGNGQVMRHMTEGTVQLHPEYPVMSGSWLYQYDANGRLVYYKERGFDLDSQRTNRIERWQYNPSGRLVSAIEDNNANGRPDRIENWIYDAGGKLLSYNEDEQGDGASDGSTHYQYEATDWGYLFSASAAWRHDEPPPPKPVADPRP